MNVSVYTEPGMASVNSHLVDVGEGLLVVDAQRSLSSASRLLAQIRATQQPVLAVALTHPHPDHFGGLSVLAAAFPDAPIYALRQTRDAIQNDEGGYIALSKKVLGDDFDTNIPLPTHIVKSKDELTIGGTRFFMDDAGLGEASCMLLLHALDHDTLFCADVVQNGMTAFLLEGRLVEWQTQLELVAALYGRVATVYPGHGPRGTAQALFAYQKEYLETFRTLVSENKDAGGGTIGDAGKARVVHAMNAKYPGFLPVAEIPDLLKQNVDAVAKELG